MTPTTNARVAGITSFVYLGAGIASLALAGQGHAREVLAVFTVFGADPRPRVYS
jgi:hypothetical protein